MTPSQPRCGLIRKTVRARLSAPVHRSRGCRRASSRMVICRKMFEGDQIMAVSSNAADIIKQVHIPIDAVVLEGDLCVPADAHGMVLFAHGSGSSRHSSRNRFVAAKLNQVGMATLLFDLLTAEEEQ